MCRLAFKFLYSKALMLWFSCLCIPGSWGYSPVSLGLDKKPHILRYSKPTFSGLSPAKTNQQQPDPSLEQASERASERSEEAEATPSLHLPKLKASKGNTAGRELKTQRPQFSGALRIKQRPDYKIAASLCVPKDITNITRPKWKQRPVCDLYLFGSFK